MCVQSVKNVYRQILYCTLYVCQIIHTSGSCANASTVVHYATVEDTVCCAVHSLDEHAVCILYAVHCSGWKASLFPMMQKSPLLSSPPPPALQLPSNSLTASRVRARRRLQRVALVSNSLTASRVRARRRLQRVALASNSLTASRVQARRRLQKVALASNHKVREEALRNTLLPAHTVSRRC